MRGPPPTWLPGTLFPSSGPAPTPSALNPFPSTAESMFDLHKQPPHCKREGIRRRQWITVYSLVVFTLEAATSSASALHQPSATGPPTPSRGQAAGHLQRAVLSLVSLYLGWGTICCKPRIGLYWKKVFALFQQCYTSPC